MIPKFEWGIWLLLLLILIQLVKIKGSLYEQNELLREVIHIASEYRGIL